MIKKISALFLGVIVALPVLADDYDNDVLMEWMDGRYDRTARLARSIWEYAEVGYQEHKSSELLQSTLVESGFEVESGVAGIPTAFVATYGSGGPVIGILAEFDALPGVNQDSVPVRQAIDGKHAAHACGHNLFGAGSVGAAIAVKHWLESTGFQGTVRLYGTPAEEGGSGKVYMVREGLFEDVDFVIHWHPGDSNNSGANSSLANRSAKFRFRGAASHASSAPDKGRSALDGVEAMNMMVNMMREHVPQETRIHHVITSGGEAPNVVPEFAEVFYYVRHPDVASLKEIWPRLEAAARGAAMGTGTQVDWEIIHGNHPLLPIEALARASHENLLEVGGVHYSADEQAYAEELYKSLDNPRRKLGSETQIDPFQISRSGGSTDVGDISQVVPTVGLRTATYVPGTPAHSWQSAATAGTTIGFKAAHNASKVMTMTAIDLFTDEDLRRRAVEEFESAHDDDFVYEPLLGDRAPPLDYRN